MNEKRRLILVTAVTVFLTALLVTVGVQARSAAEADTAVTEAPAEAAPAPAATVEPGVDPRAAARQIEQANRQIEEAGRTIETLQAEVARLQGELDDAYATMADREEEYQALLEQYVDPETAKQMQEQLQAYRDREQQNRQQGLTTQRLTELENENAALRAQLQEAYRIMKEREAAYQAQLNEAYAQLQAAYNQQQQSVSSGGGDEGASYSYEDDDYDDDEHEERENDDDHEDEHEEHEDNDDGHEDDD